MNSPLPGTSVDKAIDVLFHLHAERAPRGVTAIARGLGLPKSSTHRLLSTLSRRGLVERDAQGRYRTGMGLAALGYGAAHGEPIVAAARAPLEEHAVAVGETLFLVGERAGDLYVLLVAEGEAFLRAAPRVGSRVPVHATAVGKLYLALAPDRVRNAVADRTRFTKHTCVAERDLVQAVDAVRRRGWAENRDEWIAGLSVIAAPVRREGQLLAAVALAAATPRLETLAAQGAAADLCRVAARVAARLAGRAP